MRKRALLPFLGTAVVGFGVLIASWPDAHASSRTSSSAVSSSALSAAATPELRAVSLVAAERSGGSHRGGMGAEVLGVDLPRGTALLHMDGGERVVRGTPAQLLGLAPGDAVNLYFRAYGSETWLWPPQDGADVSRFATWGTLTGPVEGIDPFRGAVRVGGHHLSAHPDDVAELAPGERITLRFARVGDALWALGLEREQAAGAAELAGSRLGRLKSIFR